MISSLGTQLWTPVGWLRPEYLYVGLKIMSFNPSRGVCEYDEIKEIQTDYMSCMGYGVNSRSMSQLLTADHDLLYWNIYRKKLTKRPIEQKFMTSANATVDNAFILSLAPFEPYLRTADLEDVKYSARIAASQAKHKFCLADKVRTDLGGYEARVWLDTFFHWNKMLYGPIWMATVELNNRYIRDILYEIASRAGVGVKHRRIGHKNVSSITPNGFVTPKKNVWFKKAIQSSVFNITTKNGNVLARNAKGNFLIACNEEKDAITTM